MTDLMGAGTTWPRPQIEVRVSVSDSSSMTARFSARPRPRVMSVRMSTILADPTRQGTHFPHDSFLKNRTAFRAMSSMQVPSAQMMTAPDPSMEPAWLSALNSSGVSIMEAGRKPDDAPDGAQALRALPPRTPPARSSSSRAGVPRGIS